MPKPLQNPDQELRFTRARQGLVFWLLGAVLVAVGVTILATAYYRDVNPHVPHGVWALLPFAAAAGCLKLAWRMTKHAYVILTPLGVEIFPFFRPEHGMQVMFWQEIAEVDADHSRLTLHRNLERTSGIHLSLRPVPLDRRQLLVEAVRRRVNGGQAQQ